MNFVETKRFIQYAHNTRRLVPLLLGHTGVGKTELVVQYCQETYHKDPIILQVAQLEPSDFVGLYKVNENGRTDNCVPSWLPHSNEELVKQGVAKTLKDKVEAKGSEGGIIFLDEINRGHEDIRQALYQLIGAGKLHTWTKPDSWHVIAAANPSNGYETYEFDKALVNRFAWVKFKPDASETISYLSKKHGQNPLIDWIKTQTELIDLGEDNFKVEDMALTPRILEAGCLLYNEVQNESQIFIRKSLETIIPEEKVASFIAYLDEVKHINYIDVLNGVKTEKVKKLVKDGRQDVISTITMNLAEKFAKYEHGKTKIAGGIVDKLKVKDDEALKNLAEYLGVIPPESAGAFVDRLDVEKFESAVGITTVPVIYKALEAQLRMAKEAVAATKPTNKK